MKSIVQILLITLVFIVGCQYEWHFKITDLTDPTHPHFCLSSSENCSGRNVKLPMIAIYAVSDKGEKVKDMWIISNINNARVFDIIYGKVPDGYKENNPAIPLQSGVLYSINGNYFFKLNKNGSEIDVETYNHIDFLKNYRRSQ